MLSVKPLFACDDVAAVTIPATATRNNDLILAQLRSSVSMSSVHSQTEIDQVVLAGCSLEPCTTMERTKKPAEMNVEVK